MSHKSDKKLISIVGPTAIGKTSLSIKLAQHLNTEIISCDSRQFFKEIKIGTAAPTEEELSQAKHHFIGNLSIQQDYSVGDFEKEALKLMDKLFQKYNILIMVGGSGLYERAINEGMDEFPDISPSIKEELINIHQEKGLDFLQNQLQELDPEYYNQVDLQNPSRVIRALEICIGSGKPYSSFLKNNIKKRNFTSVKIGLEAPREIIYERINQRVSTMIDNDLVDEVKDLLPFKNKNALQTVGYKEIFEYLEGKTTLETAIEEIKKNSRRYAKRQLTWYRKDKNVEWFNYQNFEGVLSFVDNLVRNAQ